MFWKWLAYSAVTAMIAYFCGNVNGAIMTSQLKYSSDVREHGSGNAGLTNYYRTFGKRFVAQVIFIDMFKAMVAVIAGGLIFKDLNACKIGMEISCVFVVAGHMFPAVYGFHGGKGVLSTVAATLIIDWRIALCVLAVFVLIFFATRYVSLASMVMCACIPIAVIILHKDAVMAILSAINAGMIIYMHRSNISRLVKGTESKFKF